MVELSFFAVITAYLILAPEADFLIGLIAALLAHVGVPYVPIKGEGLEFGFYFISQYRRWMGLLFFPAKR